MVAKFDEAAYRRRGFIEPVIGWLKECRNVATRFEKLARDYLSMAKLAMIGRYLRSAAPGRSTIQRFQIDPSAATSIKHESLF